MGRFDDHNRSVTDEARRWVVRLTSGDMTEREMARFRKWRLQPAHDRVFTLEMANWRKLGQLREGFAASVAILSPAQMLCRRIRRRFVQSVVVAAAAGVLLLIGPGLYMRVQADHVAGSQIKTVSLPDGSRAILDAGSSIAVDFDEARRRVELLRGRVWFDVAHRSGPAFEVAAAGGTVRDIGTAFEVSRDGERVETAVSAGRVRVMSPMAEGMELTAGQRVTFGGNARLARAPDMPIQRVSNWRSGNIVLDGVKVRQAIQEVARYRSGPTWVWGRLDSRAPITVVLRSDQSEGAMDALAAAENLSLLRLPGGILIVMRGSAS